MRIFVSSSFEDLREHRTAAIRVLRQLGHEVLAMEDMVAGSSAPLSKVLEMVDRSEAYVGIFAWRYGHVPDRDPAIKIPVVDGTVEGDSSITEYEYRLAKQRKLPIMAFLLDEHYPWPPHLIDGFDTTRAPANADNIRALRRSLQEQWVVSWFTTPSDLEARVSAAVTMAGLTHQLRLDLQCATAIGANTGVPKDTLSEGGIKNAILEAGDHQRALKIDLATSWWSTRLYLIASLANRLTQARRILVIDTRLAKKRARADVSAPGPGQPADAGEPAPADASAPGRGQLADERFIGQLSTSAVLSTIGPKWPALGAFVQSLQARPVEYNDVGTEIQDLIKGWHDAFGGDVNEANAKVDLTAELLRRWFGDALLQQPVHITDLQRATVVDLLRVLGYPNDYVPVITREGDPATQRVDVVDKVALNARLAQSYLVELQHRARIA
jgi:hypothetical protein